MLPVAVAKRVMSTTGGEAAPAHAHAYVREAEFEHVEW
jgi:hypothetical protein